MSNIVLKYMGNGEYIVMIAMRDLTDYDIEEYANRDGMNEEEIINMLCSRGLYQVFEEFICEICGKPYKSGKALIKHELWHIEKSSKTVEDSNNGNSTNSIKETDTDR